MGRAERPRFCLRGSTDNIREWRTGRWHPYGHRLLPRFPAGDLQLYRRADWPPHPSGGACPTGGWNAELPSDPVGSQLGVRLSRGGFQFRTQYLWCPCDVAASGSGVSTHLDLSRPALDRFPTNWFVIPAKAGTQGQVISRLPLDPRFRGGDESRRNLIGSCSSLVSEPEAGQE